MIWGAALLAGLGVMVWSGPAASVKRWEAVQGRAARGKVSVWVWWLMGCGVAGGVGIAWFPMAVVFCVGIVAGTIWSVIGHHLRRRAFMKKMKEVTQAAQIVESLLGMGYIPTTAVVKAAEQCPVLSPVKAAVSMGTAPWDVLGDLARAPGAAGLGRIARAWRASEISGASMSETLTGLREQMDEDSDHAAVLAGELASPRATGQLLGMLPLAGLGIAWMIGADPVSFFQSLPGRVCLEAGIALGCAGVLWSERMGGEGS